jgi:hypothetical protein
MTAKTNQYFSVWETSCDTIDVAKSCEELLGKVEEYSQRLKLDGARRRFSRCWSWWGDAVGGCDFDESFTIKFEGESKGEEK